MDDGGYLNLMHVRIVKFNASKNRTELWFSSAPHDTVSLSGDRTAEIVGTTTTKSRR
jgi:hypothetical protein